jgi:hypothetical protein
MSAADWSELEGYEALVSALRASAPAAPERLRQRVLEGAPVPRRWRSRRQRLLFVVVPAAVVLAVGAALVHGFVNSGNPRSPATLAAAPATGVVSKTVHRDAARPASTTTAAGAVADSAGKQFAPEAEAPSKRKGTLSSLHAYSWNKAPERALKGTLQQAVTIPKNRLVHAVASLEVGVKRSNLSQATNDASQIVGSFGGYAQSVRFESSRQGYGSAVLALRVPVQKAQAAIAKLSTLGRLLSQQVSTQDLQTKLSSQNSGIGSLRRAIAVYEHALESTTLTGSERVTIQIRLSNARHALARLHHARNGTLASGANADISLVLTTQSHAVVPLHHQGSSRFGRLLGSAAHFLAWEGIIVLYALVVISPVLVLGGLAWLLLRERRRREERLLARA